MPQITPPKAIGILIAILSILDSASVEGQTSQVFNDAGSPLTFRYPLEWHRETAQYKDTLALLYADDGSLATCNISARKRTELSGASTGDIERLNELNHTKSILKRNLSRIFAQLSIEDYQRQNLALYRHAGFVRYTGMMRTPEPVKFSGRTASGFIPEYSISVLCHQPDRTGLTSTSSSNAFEMIVNTLLPSKM